MASRVRGCLALRPTADARGYEIVVESAAGIATLGPYREAADLERAFRESLAKLLGIRERPSPRIDRGREGG